MQEEQGTEDQARNVGQGNKDAFITIVVVGIGVAFIMWSAIICYICYSRKLYARREDSEEGQTEIPPPTEAPVDVPPDIVVSVIRSSSGIFSGTLSAVSTVSGIVSSGLSRLVHDERYAGDPPPYEEPPSYKVATEQPVASVVRSDTV